MSLLDRFRYKPSFSEIHEYTMDLGKLQQQRAAAKSGSEQTKYDAIIDCAQEVLIYLLRKEKR